MHVFDDAKGYYKSKYNSYAYVLDANGMYNTLDGKTVKRIPGYKVKEYDKSLLYESDVKPEMRFLIDKYGLSDDISKNHATLIFDIEVESADGFPDQIAAEQEVTAISCWIKEIDSYILLLLDKDNRIKNVNKKNIKIIVFEDEVSLLDEFMNILKKINPTILSGWNINNFDIPYLYNRYTIIFGEDVAKQLSPINIVKEDHYNEGEYKIAGVSCLDYLMLYKKFEQNQKQAYSLDFIGELEIDLGKVKYDKSLDDLYKTDIDGFIEYCFRDVEIVKQLDKKLDYIEITKMVCHKGHVPYEDILMSSRYLEGAILTYLKNNEIILPNKKPEIKLALSRDHNSDESKLYVRSIPKETPLSGMLGIRKSKSSSIYVEYKEYQNNYFILKEPIKEFVDKSYKVSFEFTGARVKPPKPGRFKWIFDLDLKSMYPFSIITLNISPETKKGKVFDFDPYDFYNNKDIKQRVIFDSTELLITYSELRELLIKYNCSIASNGIIYSLEKRGLIPNILELWSFERDDVKIKRDEHKEGSAKYQYFDRLQARQKVLLNSLYGVIGLQSFRFYDLDNAEATTSSGRTLITFSEKVGNLFYNKELKTDIDYCIYIDTDSTFFSSLPLIEKRFPDADFEDDSFMINKTLEITKEIQNFINDSYKNYSNGFHCVKNHSYKIKQELVAKSGFWLNVKKRYALLIVDKEGVRLEKPKLEVKGLDTVRSDFPNSMREFMKETLSYILDFKSKEFLDKHIEQFKEKISSIKVEDISRSSSVNGIGKYSGQKTPGGLTEIKKGAQSHIKGCIYYNDLINMFDQSKDYKYIRNKDKIKSVYLKDNPYKFESLSYRGYDDPPEIMEFIEKYIDRNKIFELLLVNKLNSFYKALEWGEINALINKNVNKFFSF